ncbi:MAG: gamma-glutamyltransferase family protein [Solirubrobacterales bacterium]
MTGSRGCVAAGHPVTAEAGAWALREGGNAVDAAVAATLASFVAESPLTGLGAGGYMLVHPPAGGDDVLLDFFVEVPGRGGIERKAELVAAEVRFTSDQPQIFHVGAASCGVPGNPAGLERAIELFGTMPLAELVRPAVRAAREGVEVTARQVYFHEILEPILTLTEEGREVYAPAGRIHAEGELFRFAALAEALELYAAEGSEPFYTGDVARAMAEWVGGQGGTLTLADLEAYATIAREPVRGRFRGRDVLTNPPPSSGGILIVLALELLDRVGEIGVEEVVEAMEDAQSARTEEFLAGLYEDGFAERFISDRLGSTTHITVVDRDGRCASITCSNGTGSGLIVPGTGVHVNNMLGESDLNPLGFHRHRPGVRMPSMMAPTVVLRDGEVEVGLGSGGSNRIRSAILQALIGMLDRGLGAQDAVDAPRVHFEEGVVHAEPGTDPGALERLEQRGLEIARWADRNVFFGGVHSVGRDLAGGVLEGAGDPRRGGAVAWV